MLILAIKLLLVPFLLALVTLAGRRWGPGAAGWVGSFPIVAGPVLLVVTLENGALFGAEAATAAMAGLAPTILFLVAYGALSATRPWWQSVLLAYLAWALAVTLLSWLPSNLVIDLLIGGLALALAPLVLKAPGGPGLPQLPNRLELPARMLVGLLLVFVSSAIADAFGPRLAGYTSLFPLIGGVVASFSHALHGRESALRFLVGMRRGMWSVGVFCLVLALVLPRAGTAVAFGAALVVTLLFHATLRPVSPGTPQAGGR